MENSQQFGNFYHRADKPMKMVLRLVVIIFMVIIGWNVITGRHGKFLGWEYNISDIERDTVKSITSPVINQPKVETKGSVKNQNNGVNNGTIGDTYQGSVEQRHLTNKKYKWIIAQITPNTKTVLVGCITRDVESLNFTNEIKERLLKGGYPISDASYPGAPVHPGQIAIHYADQTVANIIVSPQSNAVSR